GEKFIKITGEVGTGKTLLCRHILQDISDRYMCAFVANPYLTPRSVLLAIVEELGISEEIPGDNAQLLEVIRNNLLEHKKAGKQLVFLIDEAQAMTPESILELAKLTDIRYRDRPLVQIILFGQPELDDLLATEGLRKVSRELAISYNLPALNEQEVAAYLRHRLDKAGSPVLDLFSDKAVADLNAASKGLPRLINILAHKALIVAFGRDNSSVSDIHIRRSIEESGQVPSASGMKRGFGLSAHRNSFFFLAMVSSSLTLIAVYMMVLS
ncbi:MAG: AAA family ATPase, partial [Pseudohongiellaceae bacterium]